MRLGNSVGYLPTSPSHSNNWCYFIYCVLGTVKSSISLFSSNFQNTVICPHFILKDSKRLIIFPEKPHSQQGVKLSFLLMYVSHQHLCSCVPVLSCVASKEAVFEKWDCQVLKAGKEKLGFLTNSNRPVIPRMGRLSLKGQLTVSGDNFLVKSRERITCRCWNR